MSIQTFVTNLWERRVVRFACVGVVNTLNDLILLNIFVFVFGLKLLVANLFSASISIVISYFLTHKIVFKSEHKLSMKLFLKFITVTGLSILAVQTLVIYGFEHTFTTHYLENLSGITLSDSQIKFLQINCAKIVAVACGMVWNFALYHLVVFRDPKEEHEPEEEAILPY
ncbi:MAG TPA: GtrA family protein [Methylomirabilota bacterium]|nr:GtrA family protein [Methylomirabilota bacterium]